MKLSCWIVYFCLKLLLIEPNDLGRHEERVFDKKMTNSSAPTLYSTLANSFLSIADGTIVLDVGNY